MGAKPAGLGPSAPPGRFFSSLPPVNMFRIPNNGDGNRDTPGRVPCDRIENFLERHSKSLYCLHYTAIQGHGSLTRRLARPLLNS